MANSGGYRDTGRYAAYRAAKTAVDPNWQKRADLEKYRKHKDKIKARVAAYRRANPDKVAFASKRRRARLMAADDGFTYSEWLEILDKHRHCCAYCFGVGKLTIDHVIPLSKGGRHAAHNIVPACVSCNCSKKDTLDFG